jgi:hypothetical protein
MTQLEKALPCRADTHLKVVLKGARGATVCNQFKGHEHLNKRTDVVPSTDISLHGKKGIGSSTRIKHLLDDRLAHPINPFKLSVIKDRSRGKVVLVDSPLCAFVPET